VRESAGGGRGANVAPDVAAFEAALSRADRVVEAEYEFPFQSHACMAPACAVCDYRGDHATLWTGSQKPHYAAEGVAKLLGLPVEKVRGAGARQLRAQRLRRRRDGGGADLEINRASRARSGHAP
jgi:CO/xanthine dehydrogenase Mo-binding subunit